EGHLDVGADAETRQSLAPAAAHPSPLARAALRRQTPEVGAECVNSACSDLCGGCAAMRIPTANRIGQLRPFMPEKTHVENDRSQGKADVAHRRNRSEEIY